MRLRDIIYIIRLIVLTILLVSMLNTNAFSQKFTYYKKLNWSGNSIIVPQNSSGKLHSSVSNSLDMFDSLAMIVSENILVSDKMLDKNDVKVYLSDVNFSSVNSKNFKNCFKIANTYSFSYDVYYSRRQTYVCYSMFPLFRDSNTNGIKRLDSFLVNIDFINTSDSSNSNRVDRFNSVLSDGHWVKIAVENDDIYKISFEQLIEYGFTNPANIRIFGNCFGQLSYMNSDSRPVDLQELPVFFFNESVYFFGKGPNYWSFNENLNIFECHKHLYSDKAFYFITDKDDKGKRIRLLDGKKLPANRSSDTFNDFLYHGKDSLNLIHSGRDWYAEHFDVITEYNFSFNIEGIDTLSDSEIYIATAVRSNADITENKIVVSVNSQTNLLSLLHPPVSFQASQTFATKQDGYASFVPEGENVIVDILFNKGNGFSEAWLDYFTLNFRRKLEVINDKALFFRDVSSVGQGNITNFVVNSAYSTYLVWDITNPLEILNISAAYNNSQLEFSISTDSLREFVAFSPLSSAIAQPEFIGEVENQNLHGSDKPEMIIVTPDYLIQYANKLAGFHKNRGLKVEVTTLEQIYNEFSCGMVDVSAIRDYVRYVYELSSETDLKLKYLLLFGDGSYDNRPDSEDRSRFIPTYQTAVSLEPVYSFVSDDFYGLLDENEGEYTGLLDIGVGRLPVSSESEAHTVLSKIERYYKQEAFGSWRNNILMIADDGDSNTHLYQAEGLSNAISENYPVYNINKLYFDAFPLEQTNFGEGFPAATDAANDMINRGVQIINYTGHGSEISLGSERVVTVSDILSWSNTTHLSLFMTATCEFSRFDELNRTSAGELILMNPNGGGIALFSTTRLVYSTPNYVLNQKFYNYILERDQSDMSFGDVMLNTKIATGQGYNKRNFTLLGDPAIGLSIPYNIVKLDSINGYFAPSFQDTITSLSPVKLSGEILMPDSTVDNSFDGVLYVTIFDKENEVSTLGSQGNLVVDFKQFENVLFKGKASIKNGNWEISFITPQDMSQAVGNGKFSFYAIQQNSSSNIDANGSFNNYLCGGINTNPVIDTEGPVIDIYLNDKDFISGDTVKPDVLLLVNFSDSSGINNTGLSIGRDIVAIIDGVLKQKYILTAEYEADLDSYQSGEIKYKIEKLPVGRYSLGIKAWDVANNYNEVSVDFEVSEIVIPKLNYVYNYPNPFTHSTGFYFDHNLKGIELNVQIDIFTITGKLVKHLEEVMTCNSSLSEPVFWDGCDDFGNKIGRGVYLYRLKVITEQGYQIEKLEKLVSLK